MSCIFRILDLSEMDEKSAQTEQVAEKGRFAVEFRAFWVVQNHHSRKILRPGPTVRDLFFALFPERTFSATCEVYDT